MHQGLFEKTSLKSLVSRADAALYAAKKAGRDRVQPILDSRSGPRGCQTAIDTRITGWTRRR